MTALISQFISHISQCFLSKSGDNLLASIPLESAHAFLGPLRQSLVGIPTSSISNLVNSSITSIPAEARDLFSSFLVALLKHVRGDDVPPHNEAEEAYGQFSRLHTVYSETNRLYAITDQDGYYTHAFLNPFIIVLAKSLVNVSSRAASLSTLPLRDNKSARSIRDLTRQVIERSMQTSSSQMTDSEWFGEANQQYAVGDIVWSLGNILFRIYAERKLHTQSTELSKTLSALQPAENKRLASRGVVVRQADLCESYYWRGKLGVVLLDMRGAKYWLDKAWSSCPAEGRMQRRAILIRLIPVNLLLGHLPSLATLQQYDLLQFAPLIQAFRTGNLPSWRRILDQQREWFRRRSIWLILFERGEILVWRNLLRNSLKMYYAVEPQAPRNRCPTYIFVAAAERVFAGSGEVEDGTIELEDIISVISSCIDQSLILGQLSYSQKQLVMKPSPDGMGGFPRIAQVVPRRIEAIT